MRGSTSDPMVVYGAFFQDGVRSCGIVGGGGRDAPFPVLSAGEHFGRLYRSDGSRADIEFSVGEASDARDPRPMVPAEDSVHWRRHYFTDQLSPAGDDVRVAFWRNDGHGKDVSRQAAPDVALRSIGGDGATVDFSPRFAGGGPATMQVVTADGSSFFIRIPPSDRHAPLRVRLMICKVPEPGENPAGTAFPFQQGTGRFATAYNTFLALKQYEAADAVGRVVAERVSKRGSDSPSLINALIAAQWALRSDVERAQVVDCVEALGAHARQSDAVTLRWLLTFDHEPKKRASLGRDLLVVFARLRAEPPIFTETLRLLTDRLRIAKMALEGRNAWSDGHAAGYDYILRFSRALVWPSVNTTYRGFSPDMPDRSASVAYGISKKKLTRLLEQKRRLESRERVCVVQVRSSIRRPADQAATLSGLGLGRLNRARVLEDSPAVRGMIRKVCHLVEVLPMETARRFGAEGASDAGFMLKGGTLPNQWKNKHPAHEFPVAAE